MAEQSQELDFFAEEELDTNMDVDEEPQKIPQVPLFLADSDDEEPDVTEPPPENSITVDDEDDIMIMENIPRSSSVVSDRVSTRTLSPSHSDSESAPPAKRRRVSSPPQILGPRYIGDFLIPNAWSTVSGKGYIKIDEPVRIERDQDQASASNKKAEKKKKDEKKQLTLSAMLKNQPSKTKQKQKQDNIVRLVNSRGFEFGRLPQDVCWWVAKLLDLGLVEFRGKMTDCPEKLSTGADLIVSVDVYILPSAFTSPLSQPSSDRPKGMFNEGMETPEERSLRERKNSILRMFEVLSLKPQVGAQLSTRKEDLRKDEKSSKPKGKKVTEIVGDGEEVEVDDSEDLSKTDLDTIYKKAQHNDHNMKEMEPADSFSMTLRGYQKQALFWMISLETGKADARDASSMHPLWTQYSFPQKPDFASGVIDLSKDETPFYFNHYSSELSLEFPKAERNCRGGILADVGMGKTIMLSALIQTNRDQDPVPPEDESKKGKRRQLKLNKAFQSVAQRKDNCRPSIPKATLIVAPTSLLNQWLEELQRSSKPGALDVLVWHGQNRLDLDSILDGDEEESIKVVITSYGTLASEHAKSSSPVFEIEWLRVILDEAHSCKSRTSKTAKAAYALKARRRWAVTGTPIVNKLEDLYSLLKFLDFKPWSDFAFFRSFITVPFLDRDPKAIEIVQVILESILLRREKNMRDVDGKMIVDLPAKEVVVEHLEFSPAERKLYDSFYISAKRNFEQLNAKGLVSKNYTHILAMLMKLRRAVLHPRLVLSSDDERALSPSGDGTVQIDDIVSMIDKDDTFAEKVIEHLKSKESEDSPDCPICLDVVENPMMIPKCLHQCCKECIFAYLTACEAKEEVAKCPTCSQGPLKETDLIEIFQPLPSSQEPRPEVILRRNNFHTSTKLTALIENLNRLRAQDPCFRAVVFSQFTSFLDLIESALKEERFEWYRYDGSMDLKKRNSAITQFKSLSRKAKVMIISLKAGGVGLNLTVANHVFMMDCWWNAATENQAIDRVHRLGQEKTVYVKHFIIANTIEGRIVQIQKRKTALVKEAFRSEGKGEPESIENLKIMFGDSDN